MNVFIARRPGLGSTWWSSWFNLLTRLDWYFVCIFWSLFPAEVVGQYLSPFQDSLPGLGLEAGQARPPDLETAVAVLEAHGDQVRPINIKNISNKDFFKYSKQGGACPGACQLARLHLLAQAGRIPHWVSGGQVGLQS